jgi:WD40 repeat protein
MLKFYTLLGTVLIIVVLIITTTALFVGEVIPTYAATAVISSPRRSQNGFMSLTLFDIPRNLRARYPMPIKDILNLLPWYGNERVIVTTQRGSFRDKDYEGGLYLHNIYTGETITVSYMKSETPLGGNIYYPIFSPDHDRMVYFDPYDQNLYLYDIRTRIKRVLWTAEENNPGFIPVSWSPDGTRIAFNPYPFVDTESPLVVINIESMEIHEYLIQFEAFTPEWSPNGEYLSLLRFSPTVNMPVYIVRVSDGKRLPFTENLEAIWSKWGMCDGNWLVYSQWNRGQRPSFILNTQTGETVRMNDHPMLAQVKVRSITPLADCEHFILTSYQTNTRSGNQYEEMYLVDRNMTNVRLIDENANFIAVNDNTLFYESLDSTTKQATLYRRTLVPYSVPSVVAQYESVDTWMQWAEDYSFAVFTADNTRGTQNPYGGRLIVLDTQQGEKRFLTYEEERVTYFGLYRWEN